MIGRRQVTRIRRSVAGSTIGPDGRAAPRDEASTTIFATVVPAKGHVIERAPEGVRERVELRAYTDDELRATSSTDDVDGDLIEIDGVRYEVVQVDAYSRVIPHYAATLARPR